MSCAYIKTFFDYLHAWSGRSVLYLVILGCVPSPHSSASTCLGHFRHQLAKRSFFSAGKDRDANVTFQPATYATSGRTLHGSDPLATIWLRFEPKWSLEM